MIYHIDNTRDNGSEDRIVHVDATFVMSWQIAHDYISRTNAVHEHHWREACSKLSRASDHMHRAQTSRNVTGVGVCHQLERKNA